MSEENKALIRRYWEEFFNKRNLTLADELAAPDFVNHAMPPGTPHGPEAFRRLMSMLNAAFQDHHITVDDMIAGEGKVVSRVTFSGTHTGEYKGIPATGKRFTQEHIHIHRIAGGKIAEHWVIRDDLGLMQQLGVVPMAGQRQA